MADTDVEKTEGLMTLYIFGQLVGLFSVLSTFYWCVSYNSGFGFSSNSLFSWHPLFMSIGLIYFLGNGIVVYRILRDRHKRTLKLLHAVINVIGLIFSVLAAVAIFAYHNQIGLPHLYSLHSWVGFITVVLYLCQAVAGLSIYLFDIVSIAKKVSLTQYHVYFGHLVFVLGIASALIGLNEKAIISLGNEYSQGPTEAWLINFIGFLFVIFGAFIVFITSNTLYKRYPRAEDNELLRRNYD